MKNIFLVINKEKIYAYVVSILTIVTLFFMSSMINSDFKDSESASTEIIENEEVTQDNNSIEDNNAKPNSNAIENSNANTNSNAIEDSNMVEN